MFSNDAENEDDLKAEELFRLGKDAYASAEKRFDDSDGKVGRYLVILFVILGAATISVDRLRVIVSNDSMKNIVFACLVGASYLCGVLAFVYLVRALRIQQVRALKNGDAVAAYFSKYTLAAGRRGLASAFFAAAEQFRGRTQNKLHLARRGFNSLLAATALAVMSAGVYLIIDLPEDTTMTFPGNGGGDSDANQSDPTPSTEPSDDPTQAAEDASQLFEDMQKSGEGGENREKG